MLYTRPLLTGAALALLAGCNDAVLPTAPAAAARSLTGESAAGGTAVTLTSSVGASLCADVSGALTTPGAAIITWTCHGQSNQLFTPNASNEIRTSAGLCLDASGGRGRDGDVVIAWTCHGGANQKWAVVADGRVVGVNGKCLDVPGGRTTPGAQLIIWSCHGGTNQRWAVSAAGGPGPSPTPPEPAPPPAAPPSGDPAGVQPELPRSSVDVTMPTQTGRTIHVPAGGDLQAALNNATPGDVITLAPGATYSGNFYLWPRQGNGVVVVRTAVPDAVLGSPGTRMTPARAAAANLAKIVANHNGLAAITTNRNASNWRFVGVEIGVDPSLTILYDIVALGTAGAEQQTLAQVPTNIILDRVWVHGNANLGFSRCIALNSSWSAVVDSYISDCHQRGGEAQGIAGWNGPGPYLIQNNYIDGSTENVMFGGNDPSIPNLIPSDITIRNNHFHKPLRWKGVWTVKNLFELKNAQRLLVEGNVFDGSWADGQAGWAWVLKSQNSDGGADWSVTRDVTLRRNWVRNVGAGVLFSSHEAYSGGTAVPMSRVRIENNVFERVNVNGYNGAGRILVMSAGTVNGALSGTTDVAVVNNTFAGTGSASPWGDNISHFLVFTGPSHTGLVVARNVTLAGEYGVFGDGGTIGAPALARYAPDGRFENNLLVGAAHQPSYPAGTQFSANPGSTWSSPVAGLWTLVSGVGSGLGADVAALVAAIQAVVG